MTHGIVKFWKSEKGWGAISSPELPDGCDAFVHFSDIVVSGFREVHPGDKVEFTIVHRVQDSFKFSAAEVRKL